MYFCGGLVWLSSWYVIMVYFSNLMTFCVAFDRKRKSRNTLITFCTAGVLLQNFLMSPHSMRYTHIILDDCHQQNRDVDFIMMIVKRRILQGNFKPKLIIMSATLDCDRFIKYFTFPKRLGFVCKQTFKDCKPAFFDIDSFVDEELTIKRKLINRVYYLEEILEHYNIKKSYEINKPIQTASAHKLQFRELKPRFMDELLEVLSVVLVKGIEATKSICYL